MKNKISLIGMLQNFSQQDINSIVPKDVVDEIKRSDPVPTIRIYAVGHEGVAKGHDVGFGIRALQYMKDAIRSLTNKLQRGIKVFHKHGSTNDHTGRTPVGEVVGKTLQTINDKLYSLAAVYVYPEHKDLPLDVASIEADIEFKTDGEVVDIQNITGIALGNSKTDTPGFPGATLLGAVQAFTREVQHKGGSTVTLQEIQAAIAEGKFSITDVFSTTDIMESEPAKKAKQTEYEHAKRVEKKLGEERENVISLQKQLDETLSKNKELNSKVNSANVNQIFSEVSKTRELNDAQKKFIEKHLSQFKSGEDTEKISDDFNRFIDGQLKEYTEYAELLGVKVEDKGTDEGDKKPGEGNGDSKQKGKDTNSEVDNELTNPEKNDFIPMPV